MADPSSSKLVLVCVHYGPNAVALIQRGALLASGLGGRLAILNVYDEQNPDYGDIRKVDVKLWKSLANQFDAEFTQLGSPSPRLTDTIVSTAREKGADVVVMGYAANGFEGGWFRKPFLTTVLSQLVGMDIHLVAVEQAQPAPEPTEYETGIRAWMIMDSGDMKIAFEPPPGNETEGVFYKRTNTEFDNGIFKVEEKKRQAVYQIADGEIVKRLS